MCSKNIVGNKPTGLSAYLEQAPLGTIVDAVMSYTDLPLGVKDFFPPGALSQLGTALKGHSSFRGAHGIGRGVC